MIKLALNTHKSNNYAFFCPATRLHLTITNPVGNADRISGAILRAVRANTVIDVDGVIDLKTGKLKAEVKEDTPKVQVQNTTNAINTTEDKNSDKNSDKNIDKTKVIVQETDATNTETSSEENNNKTSEEATVNEESTPTEEVKTSKKGKRPNK